MFPPTDVVLNVNNGAVPVVENWYNRQRAKPPTLMVWTFHRFVPFWMVPATMRPSRVSSVWPLGCAAFGGAVHAVIAIGAVVTRTSAVGVAPGVTEYRMIELPLPEPG